MERRERDLYRWKGAVCGKRVRGGGYSSSWDRRRVRSFFSRRGVKLGCGEKGKGSLQMERGGLREESAERGLFQQLGPQEGQELFLPTGDLDLGHGEEGSGLCLSEVFEVAEGQELPVLFVQPL